jgi:hypothetical protein
MATPADQRLLDLLDKWLKSLELHIKYSSLDDDSYSRVQPWPEHQRPSRWIIDLAKQKALALRSQVEERVKAGDAKFSDSLELMTFLANLVGAEHIERFIPVAQAESELSIAPVTASIARVPVTAADSATAAPKPAGMPGDSATGTREMPQFTGGKQRTTGSSSSEQVARVERNAQPKPTSAPKPAAPPKPATKPASAKPVPAKPMPARLAPAKPAAAKPPEQSKPEHTAPEPSTLAKPLATAEHPSSPDAAREQVIADAVRLVQWGRKWYELAEVIARMADRPSLTDVRRILKDNKADIDKKAGRS